MDYFSIAHQFYLLKLTQETSNYTFKVRKKIGVMFNTHACIHLKSVRFIWSACIQKKKKPIPN